MPIPTPSSVPVLTNDEYIQKLRALQSASDEKVAALQATTAYKANPIDLHMATDFAKDMAIKGAQGVVDVGQSVVGLGSLATGGLVGQGMRAIGYDPEATNQAIGQYLSPAQQAADKTVNDAQGFKNTLLAALSNPRSIAGSVAESLPGMVAGMGTTALAARTVALKAALATAEGEAAAAAAIKAGVAPGKAASAALMTKAGSEAAKAAVEGAETSMLGIGAATEGAQTAGQIADQSQGMGRDYSDYALPAIAAGVGTGLINLGAGKLVGDAATDMAAGTHTLQGSKIAKLAKEGLKEGVLEEMPQSAQEQVFTNIAQGKEYDEGVGNAAASGLLAGAAMGAGLGGFHSGHGGPVDNAQAPQAPVSPEVKAAKAAAVQEAVATGDASKLADTKSPTYDPVAAVTALSTVNQKADTPVEDKWKNVESAYDVVNKLSDQLDTLQKQAKSDPSKAKAVLNQAAQVKSQLDAAQKIWDGMTDDLTPKATDEQVKADLQTAHEPTEQGSAAAERVINLSMASDDRVSPEDAMKLANNDDNGLSGAQRDYLRSFSAARIASNEVKTDTDVGKEVMFGSNENMGLAQYRDRIGKAIANNAPVAADKLMGMLDNFATDHQGKLDAAVEALKKGPGTFIEKTEAGQWRVSDKQFTEEERKENGAFQIRHAKNIDMFRAEAEAINATRDELAQAKGLRFGDGSVESITPTPAPSATSAATPVSTSASEVNTAPPGDISTDLPVEPPPRLNTNRVQTVSPTQQSLSISENNSGKVDAGISVNSAPVSPARSVAAAPASSLADARSSQVAPPALATPTSREYVAKSHKAAQDIQKATADVPKFQGTTFRAVTATEAPALHVAIDSLASSFGPEIAKVKIIGMDMPKGKNTKGTAATDHNVVAINAKTFANPDLLAHTLAHELSHIRDANDGWPSEHMETLKPGGLVYEQAKASMNGSEQLTKAFNYVFNKTFARPENVQHELYAQLNALAHTNPELFKDNGPLSEAAALTSTTEAQDSTASQENGTAVEEAAPATDGQGSVEPAGQSTDASTGEPARSTGLKVLEKRIKTVGLKLNDLFRTPGFNAVAQFLKQAVASDRFKTERPLVTQQDFFSAWSKDPHLVYQFIDDYKNGTKPGDNEFHEAALNNLYSFLDSWNKNIPATFTVVYPENADKPEHAIYRYADPMQYLLTEGRNTEENVKTAMSAAAYQWILSMSHTPLIKDKGDVNAMHGRDKESYLSPEGAAAMRDIAGFRDRIINQIGTYATDALGFKADKDAPQDFLPRLRNAMGTHIMLELERQGFIDKIDVPQKTVKSWFNALGTIENQTEDTDASDNKQDGGNPNETHLHYIRFNRADDRNHTDAVRAIRDANAKTGSMLERLFGSEKAPRVAGTSPVKFIQEFAKGTQQKIPTLEAQALQETMDTPHTAIPAVLQLFDAMGRQSVLNVAGHVNVDEDAGKTFIHAINRDSTIARNQGLENEFDKAFDMLDTFGRDTQYYVEQQVGKNFRAYFTNQSLNQQTSKIHRVLFARPDWHTTLDLNNDEMVREYKIAVAMSLGLKTDQQINDKTLVKFDQHLKDNPEIMQAVQIIREGTLGENPNAAIFTDENRALVERVASAEGMMSLQALMSYAQYTEAKETGKTSFDTVLLVGVDGKTNGPMLTHLALGAADSIGDFYALLNRGGFYSTDEGQADHYSDWYGRGGNQDLYENLGANVIADVRDKIVDPGKLKELNDTARAAPKGSDERKGAWKEFFKVFTQDQLKALETVTKPLINGAGEATKYMRNFIKVPLTSFAFGSALDKSVTNMANAFIDGHYQTIEAIASGDRTDITRQDYIKSINTLIEMGDFNASKISETMPIDQLLKHTLSPEQELALRQSFDRIMGRSVKDTMNAYFKTFIERRRELNATTNAAYEVYEAAYKAAKVQEIKRLMDAGDLAYTETKTGKKPVHDMTPAQETALREKLSSLLPVMHSEYSLGQNDLKTGLYLAKSDIQTSNSSLYDTVARTYKEIPQAKDLNGNPVGKRFSRLSTKTQAWVEQSPGVIGGSYPIHSSDSAIMHKTLLKTKQTLNVHDEASNSVLKTQEVARNLNQATAETFLNYSPAKEAVYMMERQLTAMAKAIKDGIVAPGAADALFQAWADNHNRNIKDETYHITAEHARELIPKKAAELAFRADYMRLTALSKLKAVDQYVWEGGQFNDEAQMAKIRATAAERLEKLSTDLQPGTVKALAYLADIADENPRSEVDPYNWLNFKDEDRFADAPDTASEVAPPLTPGVAAAVGSNTAQAAATLRSVVSPWGELGQSNIPSNQSLVQAFAAKPIQTAQEAIKLLQGNLAGETQGALYGQLLSLMERFLPADLTVRFVTPETPVSEVLEGADKSRGWYVSKDGQHGVYLLSPDHLHSGLTVETVIHELLHAGLARTIEGEQAKAAADSAYTSDALSAVKEMETLLDLARDYAKKEGIKGFGEALKNVHEFASWGMTHGDFQDKVIKNLSIKTTTKGSSLFSGVKEFFTKAVDILFHGSDKTRKQVAVNGMTVLTANVAGLYTLAAQGSSSIQTNLSQVNTGSNLRDFTTHDIYNALTSNTRVSSAFDGHLKGVLSNIVDKLHGPFGAFREAVMKQSPQLPADIYAQEMANGGAPFAAKIMAAGFTMSDQEAFVAQQVEITIRAALDSNEGQTAAPHKELSRLYDEVAKTIKVNDLAEGTTPAELAHAQKLHDFLFAVEKGTDNRSDYLSRFAALGLANEQVSKALGFTTELTKLNLKDMSFTDRLFAVFGKILTWVNGKMTATFEGQQADDKLQSLVQQLVNNEAKKRNRINSHEMRVLGVGEDLARNFTEGTKKQIEKIGQSRFLRGSTNAFLRAGGAIVSTVAGDRVDLMMKNITTIRNTLQNKKYGVMMGLWNEARGAQADNIRAHTMLSTTKMIEATRDKIITSIGNATRESFDGKGEYLNDDHKAAVTAVALRTGMSDLLNHGFTMKGLHELVTDRLKLKDTIRQLEKRLGQFGNFQHYYQTQARTLGYNKATGEVRGAHLMANAANIAQAFGTNYASRVSATQASKAEAIIDQLVSLHALQHVSSKHMTNFRAVMDKEMARTDKGNGVEAVLLAHNQFQKESRERLFDDAEALQMKGYVPEIFNPHIEIVAASGDEAKLLRRVGYEENTDELSRDPADPSEKKSLFVYRDGGLQSYLSSIFSTTNMKAKGSNIHNGNLDLENTAMMKGITSRKSGAIEALFRPNPDFDPSKVKENHMAPLLNADGDVVNYRYMMSEQNKDSLLERHNGFDRLLGQMAGSIFDKEKSAEQNRKAVQALRDQYKEDFKERSGAYVMIGPKSSDPEFRQNWAMLPESTKQAVREIWGTNHMWVRNDLLDINFGYRKLSVTNVFEKDAQERNIAEKLLADMMVHIFKDDDTDMGKEVGRRKAMQKLRIAENVWQEIVTKTKGNYVVKSLSTLMGNFRSNVLLLLWQGVSPSDIIRYHRVAFKGAMDYRKNSGELLKLQLQRDSGYLAGRDLDVLNKQIIRLEDALARNPIMPLVNNGLMPTIVEDVQADQDMYSYTSRYTRKLDQTLEKVGKHINPHVKTAYDWVSMDVSTPLFKAMSVGTQLSDFVARYTMYEHLTNRKVEPMTKEQALNRAKESFITYDVPSQRKVQYANDMGLVWFTKYYIRIQKVLIQLYKENPGRAMAILAAGHYFKGADELMNAGVIHHLGNNPFSVGAFKYVDSLENTAVIKALLSPFK